MDVIQEEFGVIDTDGKEVYVLGRPIPLPPRLNRRQYSYGSESSSLGNEQTEQQQSGAHSSITPHTHHMYPSTSTSTGTLSRSSSMSRYSNDAMTYDSGKNTPLDPPSPPPLPNLGSSYGWIPIPPRRESLRRQESDSSIATMHSVETQRPIVVPHRAMRSQVSMEVLPTPTDGASYDRSLRSYRSASSLGSTSQSTRGEVRFSDSSVLRSPAMDDVFSAGPSRPPRSALRTANYHPFSDDEEDDDEDNFDNETTPRQVADATLRSTPGVIGIGEGWGSRPPTTPKRKWWRKRQDISMDFDDPLNLWSPDTTSKGRGDGGLSPVRSLWNRSVQAFGGSMPHLPSAIGERNRERRKIKDDLVQRSRSDLTPVRGKNLGAGRSLVDLLQRPLKALSKQPGSRSVPALLSTLDAETADAAPLRRSPSQLRRARSRGSSVTTETPVTAPSRMTREQRRTSGPRPPWRPASYFAPTVAEACPDVREDLDEDMKTPRPATSGPALPVEPDDRELRRTDTFGPAPDSPESPQSRPSLPTVDAKLTQQSTVGFDTLDEWALEPKERMILPAPKKPSFFRRVSNALRLSTTRSATSSRPQTPSSLRLSTSPRHRVFTPRSEVTAPIQTAPTRPSSMLHSASDLDYVLEPVRDSLPTRSKTISGATRHRRRKSWMSSGEEWVKRLSRLPEQDEDEIADHPSSEGNRSSATENDKKQSFFDIVKPGRSSGRTSPLPFSSSHSKRNGAVFDSRPGLGSGGLYTLRRLATTDLDLTLTLPEERGLNLDDILIDSRRKSIIASLDLTSGFAFPTPPARNASTFNLAREVSSRSHHSRGISEPPKMVVNTEREEGNHKRNRSEPVDGVPLLTESITTSEGGSSSSFPETPRLDNTNIASNPAYSRRQTVGEVEDTSRSSMASEPTDRETWSFYSAAEMLDDEKERLANSDAGSRCSIISETVVKAVRIPSVTNLKTKGAMVSMDDLRITPRSTRANTPVGRVEGRVV